MNATEELGKQAEQLYRRVEGWQDHTLERIAKRVKEIGQMTLADVQKLNNIAFVKQDMKEITKELAVLTGYNVSQINKIYGDVLAAQHLENKPLFDYRNKEFKTLDESRELQNLVKTFSKKTGKEFINLSNTKALGLVDNNKNFVMLKDAYLQILDKAVVETSKVGGNFYAEMRDTLKDIGGGGIRVDYGNGYTRRLDTSVRQNLLWGAKQLSLEYNGQIGEELSCDGIEIDYHNNPRPSHEFMGGRQFVLGKGRMIGGTYYPGANEALARLEDYGCLHFKRPIICGVSEPAYDKAELERLNKENREQVEYDGKRKTRYDWSQDMRKIETEIRYKQDKANVLRAAGDKDGVRQVNAQIKVLNDKYSEIANATGLPIENQRKIVVDKYKPKPVKPPVDKVVKKQEEKPLKDEYNFIPAKTIAEAEEYASRFAKDVSFARVTNIDKLNIVNKTLNRIVQLVPTKPLKELKTNGRLIRADARSNFQTLEIATGFLNETEKRKTWAETLKENKVTLEKYKNEYLGDLRYNQASVERAIKRMEEQQKYVRWSVGDDNVETTILHEYGHIVADQYYGQINGIRATSTANTPRAASVRDYIKNVFRKAQKNGDILNVSMYSNTDEKEFFAETFALYFSNKKELPDYIQEMIEEVTKND